jgi:hypothetical protein
MHPDLDCLSCSFTGLFTGTFVSLFIIYSVLAHVAGIFSSTGSSAYMDIVYHVFRSVTKLTSQDSSDHA